MHQLARYIKSPFTVAALSAAVITGFQTIDYRYIFPKAKPDTEKVAQCFPAYSLILSESDKPIYLKPESIDQMLFSASFPNNKWLIQFLPTQGPNNHIMSITVAQNQISHPLHPHDAAALKYNIYADERVIPLTNKSAPTLPKVDIQKLAALQFLCLEKS